jgi:SAM-dependent methyltransferase
MEPDRQIDDAKRIVREGYDLISEAYRDDLGNANVGYPKWLQTHLLPRLRPASSVLDLGCGNGIPTARILAEHHRVTGVDISPVQIARARMLVPGVTFIEADMASVEFSVAAFDAVVSFFALIHVPLEEQREILARVSTWLRPGGFFLATVGDQAWTGLGDFYGTTMYWSHTNLAGYRAWLAQVGIDVLANEFIPEDPHGGHQLLLGRRRVAL